MLKGARPVRRLPPAAHRQGGQRRQAVRFHRHADIAEAASAAGHPLQRAEVRLSSGPLRTVGDHVVVLHLHTDMNIELPITITAEEQG